MTATFERTFHAAQVRFVKLENVFRVFGSSAARRCVERVDRFALIGGDNSFCFQNGSRAHSGFGGNAFVNLRTDGRQHIETLLGKTVDIGDGISSCGDRLRFLRFDLRQRRVPPEQRRADILRAARH